MSPSVVADRRACAGDRCGAADARPLSIVPAAFPAERRAVVERNGVPWAGSRRPWAHFRSWVTAHAAPYLFSILSIGIWGPVAQQLASCQESVRPGRTPMYRRDRTGVAGGGWPAALALAIVAIGAGRLGTGARRVGGQCRSPRGARIRGLGAFPPHRWWTRAVPPPHSIATPTPGDAELRTAFAMMFLAFFSDRRVALTTLPQAGLP